MKTINLLILISFVSLIACNSATDSNKETAYFGRYGDTTFSEEGAINTKQLLEKLKGVDSVEAKVEVKINACCQKKGCWMTADLGDGQEMRVKFLDYAFFVPFNSAGHSAIIQGKAYTETVSVAQLKHLAKDEENKTQEEIDAITEPVVEYTFMASGVIIK
jgi:hypothetical protein